MLQPFFDRTIILYLLFIRKFFYYLSHISRIIIIIFKCTFITDNAQRKGTTYALHSVIVIIINNNNNKMCRSVAEYITVLYDASGFASARTPLKFLLKQLFKAEVEFSGACGAFCIPWVTTLYRSQ